MASSLADFRSGRSLKSIRAPSCVQHHQFIVWQRPLQGLGL
jgi:hypothetical protein